MKYLLVTENQEWKKEIAKMLTDLKIEVEYEFKNSADDYQALIMDANLLNDESSEEMMQLIKQFSCWNKKIVLINSPKESLNLWLYGSTSLSRIVGESLAEITRGLNTWLSHRGKKMSNNTKKILIITKEFDQKEKEVVVIVEDYADFPVEVLILDKTNKGRIDKIIAEIRNYWTIITLNFPLLETGMFTEEISQIMEIFPKARTFSLTITENNIIITGFGDYEDGENFDLIEGKDWGETIKNFKKFMEDELDD